MIINSLSIKNFGPYKGFSTFSLMPQNGNNIVLFGGKNGTGKTTILDAIKLCLYGNNLLGFTKKKYGDYIRSYIYRDETESILALEISYFHLNSSETYKIIRKFDIKDKFKEEFLLYKNGQLYSELNKKYWQDFIFDLIPQGLVNFFFFDGEKIEKLARDLNEIQLKQSIKGLIGITTVDNLKTNLNILKSRFLKREDINGNFKKEVERLEKEKEKIENKIERENFRLAEINNKIDKKEIELKQVQESFISEGGNLARDFEQLQIRKSYIKNEIDNISNKIKELSTGLLPLAVGLEMLKELEVQLDIEKELDSLDIEKKLLKSKCKDVLNALKKHNIQNKKIFKDIKNIFGSNKSIKGKKIHNLSRKDADKIVLTVKNVEQNLIPEARYLFDKLESLEKELIDIESSLQKAPKEEVIAPFIKRISNLTREMSLLKNKQEEIQSQIKFHIKNKEQKEKEIIKMHKIFEDKFKNQAVLNLMEKTSMILERFKLEFTRRKLEILRKEILETLSKLARKEDLISDLWIDKQTLELKLYDRNNKQITIERLSAGERQIFAIAFLWGLARTSGKPLPMIIDTPLGRLDSDHRENIAKKYLPYVSHQVIVLSTDKEIDQELFKKMEEHVSHSYHLIYDLESMSTKVEEGYFWKEHIKVPA